MSEFSALSPESAHKQNRENLWLREVSGQEEGALSFLFKVPESVDIGVADYIEVQRQATHTFAHSILSIPLNYASIMRNTSIELTSSVTQARHLPREGIVTVKEQSTGTQSISKTDKNFVTLFEAGKRIAGGNIMGRYLPQNVYKRLRSSLIGTQHITDVISAEPLVEVNASLGEFSGNPMLDDHEVDHLPGMAVVWFVEEILRRDVPSARLQSLSINFSGFIEKHYPSRLNLSASSDEFHGSVAQHGRMCTKFSGSFIPY
ncbi:hypothetical protein [Leucobacter chinensis]|uniref:hypothetical protein n=1 Tax=Leucobacter chinensis TaxID=2851010 RepID=UPI001C2259E1|nr:hypothetical protein [Leucobacter chinensis]